MRFGLVAVALVVVGCEVLAPLPQVTWDSTGSVGCTMEPVAGALVDVDGRTALENPRWLHDELPSPLVVRWPAGWQVRSSPAGLEVLDAAGAIRYRTGGNVSLRAAAEGSGTPGMPQIEGGGLLACGF